MFNINNIVRKNIANLKPYSSARDEFQGNASVFLDANENPFNNPVSRYPDPLQRTLKQKIALIKGVQPEQIFLGNGSDEPIDLLVRAFCEPTTNNIVAIDPTYGMYEVAAGINNVQYIKVLLNDNFELDAQKVLTTANIATKLIFLCSPNNPTGNSLNHQQIIEIIENFNGLVILDEAYIDFSEQPSFLQNLNQYPNLVVLQTFSKAWGLASIRLGMAFASEPIIKILNKIKYPYNINLLTQEYALEAIDNVGKKTDWVKTIINNRNKLINEFSKLALVKHIFATDANFLLIKVNDPNVIYNYLVTKGIIVRNRNTVSLCAGCLRITIGTETENIDLVEALKNYK